MKKFKTLFLLAVLLLATTLTPAWAKQLTVVTTTQDLGDAVRNIGGNRVKVITLCRPGQDPHQVEAKPSFLRTLQQADAFIETGCSLEIAWAPSLLRGARNSAIMPGGPGFLEANSGIIIMEKPNGKVDRSMGDTHPEGNPHYTLNPTNMKVAARNICAFLKRLDPQGAAIYDKGYAQYWQQLDSADKRWQAALRPYKGRAIVTYHSTWPYFASHFGLRVIGHIEPKPGISPSAAHLNSLVSTINKNNCKVIVMEPWQPANIAKSTANKANCRLLTLPILPGGVAGTTTYIQMMDYNVSQLVKAMK